MTIIFNLFNPEEERDLVAMIHTSFDKIKGNISKYRKQNVWIVGVQLVIRSILGFSLVKYYKILLDTAVLPRNLLVLSTLEKYSC